MNKYVIDLRPECKLIQQVCQSDGLLGVSTKSVKLLDELNDSYINEHFGSLLQDRYDQGYKDGRNVTETQAHNDAYQKGYEDGKNVSVMKTQNNMFNKGVEYGKTQEQNRVWEYVKKIVLNSCDGGISISELNEIFGFYTIQSIFKNYTLQQIIEKLDAYDNKTWININNALYQCPYCKAIQHKSRRCRCCDKEVTE